SLQETIQSLKLTNQELLRKGSSNNQDVVTCDMACKGLLQQVQGPRLPWTRLLLLLLVFAVGFLCHDLRSHSSFQAGWRRHCRSGAPTCSPWCGPACSWPGLTPMPQSASFLPTVPLTLRGLVTVSPVSLRGYRSSSPIP
ncbi:TMEM214 isoform 6, partial [Pan troglodytes]